MSFPSKGIIKDFIPLYIGPTFGNYKTGHNRISPVILEKSLQTE